MPPPPHDGLLEPLLRTFLGPIDNTALAILRQHLQWVEVGAGQTLMSQGDPGDAMFLTVSGRLRAYVRDEDGIERMVREMARGQVIGEMSLYTDEPRSATVVAIRDTVLVRLGKHEFQRLLETSAQASIALTRQLIRRLRAQQLRSELARPVTMGLLPITADVDVPTFAGTLATQLRPLVGESTVALIDADTVDRALAQPGLARSDSADATATADANRRIALYLDQVEATHDYVLLLADDGPTPWTRRVSRRSDELLLLADATQPPELHATETQFLMRRTGRAEATEILVLLHPEHRRCPQGTQRWLARRPVAEHVHVRPALVRDMARLARIQSRNAVGLVLGSGGARGLAHLGVLRALQEQGVEIDFVAGTGIGSVMAALVASDRPWQQLVAVAKRAFSTDPTGESRLLPWPAWLREQRLRRVIGTALVDVFGGLPDVEDLWKSTCCVAGNLAVSSEHVIRRGPLLQALLAGMAPTGVLPPVEVQGEALCDGTPFNRFPVDVMRRLRGLGRVIGVDPIVHRPTRGEASSRQRQARRLTDLYFAPALDREGQPQWSRFDSIVEQGRVHAGEVLARTESPALKVPAAAG